MMNSADVKCSNGAIELKIIVIRPLETGQKLLLLFSVALSLTPHNSEPTCSHMERE